MKIKIVENGPFLVEFGEKYKVLIGESETVFDKRILSLCRCGHSKNKPFCDGSHARVGFKDVGGELELYFGEEGERKIILRENGPYRIYVRGRYVLKREGEVSEGEEERIALCRCGHSKNKPFCDGTHKKIGFVAEKGEIIPID